MAYAIGEILLVVVGILIALYINNLNVKSQLSDLEQEYLISLRQEFHKNLIKVEASKEEVKEVNESLMIALSLFKPTNLDSIRDDDLIKCIYGCVGKSVNFDPANGVLTDIISSGKLSIIKNAKLRQILASFNSDLILLKTQLEGSKEASSRAKQYFMKYASVRKVISVQEEEFRLESISDGINNKDVFKSFMFENILLDYLLINKVLSNGHFPLISKSMEEIVEEIDAELRS